MANFKRVLITLLLSVVALNLTVTYALTPEAAANNTPPNDYAFPYYNQNHPLKVVIEVPSNPKKWPAVPLVITHNSISFMGHGVPMKVVLVAPGPAIYFFAKKNNPNGYETLKRLHELGVKMYACHAAMIAFHVSQKELFPFVGVAHPSGVTAILKYENKGYSFYALP